MLSNTQAHLASLGTSQKLAIGLCAVVMAGALVWMFQWSGQPEWVPVLPGQLWTEEEIESAKKVLVEGEYKISGRQILVPAHLRREVRGKLGQAGALPSDTRVGFEELMKETSPWKSQTQQSREWVVAYGNQLARDLEGWKNVHTAQVILQMPKGRRLGERAVKPTASVSVGMEAGGVWDRGFTQAIANFVSGATGMAPEAVQIVDANTRKSYQVHGPGSPLGDDLLELRKEKQTFFQETIERHLGFIPGVRVTCFVELETDRRRETERTPTEGKNIEKSETKKETTESRKPSASDPGVQPNTSVTLSSKPQTEEMEDASRTTEFEAALGEKMTQTEFTLGALKKLTASISVPRSYLAAIFTRQPGNDGKEPTDKDIDTLATKEFEKIRKQVKNVINAKDETAVEVAWFDDPMTQLAVAGLAAGGGEADGSVMGMVKAHGRQLGLGLLAVMSLGMMLMIVRKGPTSAAQLRDRHPAFADGEEDLSAIPGLEAVGEAMEGESAMEGHEVDESAIQEEQRVQQVSSFVRGDPEVAANLIRKWAEGA
ncbi:MAG: hypothetical protein JXQ73_24990 [Phycisphaerae bacterium]|nr:hypothetical protein [Phycisphaerae bacterium]